MRSEECEMTHKITKCAVNTLQSLLFIHERNRNIFSAVEPPLTPLQVKSKVLKIHLNHSCRSQFTKQVPSQNLTVSKKKERKQKNRNVCSLTFLSHSSLEAFLQSAVATLVPFVSVHNALPVEPKKNKKIQYRNLDSPLCVLH